MAFFAQQVLIAYVLWLVFVLGLVMPCSFQSIFLLVWLICVKPFHTQYLVRLL